MDKKMKPLISISYKIYSYEEQKIKLKIIGDY